MKRRTLEQLLAARAEKRPVALVTDLNDGQQTLVSEGGVRGAFGVAGADWTCIRTMIHADRSGPIEPMAGGRWFVQVLNPPLRLIVVGAVHIAQALVPMAVMAGFDVTVIDPRRAFATETRFPDVHLVEDWPDEALQALTPDDRTAIVALTHDPKLDDPALATALAGPAFYIGALGSRRTQAARLTRLRASGFDDEALARIRGPVGLPIGAVTPAEIGVSILAQMIETLRLARPEPRTLAGAAF